MSSQNNNAHDDFSKIDVTFTQQFKVNKINYDFIICSDYDYFNN